MYEIKLHTDYFLLVFSDLMTHGIKLSLSACFDGPVAPARRQQVKQVVCQMGRVCEDVLGSGMVTVANNVFKGG